MKLKRDWAAFGSPSIGQSFLQKRPCNFRLSEEECRTAGSHQKLSAVGKMQLSQKLSAVDKMQLSQICKL